MGTVRAIFNRKDLFMCLPTGYGKSLCYQTIPFFKDFSLVVQAIVLTILYDSLHYKNML